MSSTHTFTMIKKRNNDLVPFDLTKIHTAIVRAFGAVGINKDEQTLQEITDSIVTYVAELVKDRVPTVEEVQNMAERALMDRDYFEVAKAYIIYRYEHAKTREQKQVETIQKAVSGGLTVTKHDGSTELFSLDKIKRRLSFVVKGYEDIIHIDDILHQLQLEVYEGMSTADIERALVMVVRTMIERDPAYSYVAARLVIMQTNRALVGRTQVKDEQKMAEALRMSFKKNIMQAVADARLDPRMLVFDIDRLSKELDFSRDNAHDYLSTQTLTDRYFNRNPETKIPYENIQMFWMRVAMGLSLLEKNREERAIEFYHVMSERLYVPSTPTLFHSGTTHAQMSSCYLTTVEDSLDHIFKSISDNAQLSKWSGGIGNDWTNLRGTGALIQGTGVESQGIVPFLKIANDTTVAINRSGRRRGATCAYLETWHWDIEDFLELRKNTGDDRRRTHDMNTSNWIPDLFMKRVKEDGDWSLFSPDETPDLHHIFGKEFEERYVMYEQKGAAGELSLYKKIKAKDLWKKMLVMLFETGHPWITWKDPSNVRSPQDHVGVVHNSNLCTEITLNTSADETAVCNLGSLNIERFIVDGIFDKEKLAKVVRIAMRMLDNVVDLNFYPTKEAKQSNLRHRPVGLGVMGFQYALYKLGIRFDSEEAVKFADESMELVSYHAILGSSTLAEERGSYTSYKGSKWQRGMLPFDTLDLLEEERGVKIPVSRSSSMDWAPVRESIKKYGMRNSNCMAVAPTATISNISVTSPTIEPIYKNIFVKSNQAGDFTIVNSFLVDTLKKKGLWDAEMLNQLKYQDGSIAQIAGIDQEVKDMYKEVFEIDMRWLIKIAAHRAKWIDQSQSLNMYFRGTSGKELHDVYTYAWEMGLKTTYYLRTLGISQVEKSTVQTQNFGSTHLRQETAKVANTTVAPKAEVKLCKIEDPDCEACQ
ncbi:ribonucleoside-diphosphate reductase subunit alpha [Patescibacteria group bacterium]|nr:ribonucleoside-diphosphate reductase subunit alpha [Patescibacteria group bacterium]MBU1721237.1 ribonucleoside-diphosphate reductase subunit alpha [Patescibacteria group bacterium]MBU1901055.1 ribonucleoside-diphosphate reductase subunit alpha [Patescibacteria group bacterium]